MRIIFCLTLLGLLFIGGILWAFFQGPPTPKLPPFDPATEIRIEFPRFGGGLSQGVSPINHEKWSGPTGFSYEITNNVLEYDTMHYLLKTGNIVRFEVGGVITIDGKRAASIEDTLISAALALIRTRIL